MSGHVARLSEVSADLNTSSLMTENSPWFLESGLQPQKESEASEVTGAT